MTEHQQALIGINILKRVIEYLSVDAVTDERSQQDALDIANAAIEELFEDGCTCGECSTEHRYCA